MTQVFATIPLTDAIAMPARERYRKAREHDPLEGLLSNPWIEFFSKMTTTIDNQPLRLNNRILEGQSTSLVPTDVSIGSISAGYYDLRAYFRVTQAASTSSSLLVTFGFTETGIACTYPDPAGAYTGNSVIEPRSFQATILSDAVSPITVSTTYGSVGATPMLYRLSVILSRLSA